MWRADVRVDSVADSWTYSYSNTLGFALHPSEMLTFLATSCWLVSYALMTPAAGRQAGGFFKSVCFLKCVHPKNV